MKPRPEHLLVSALWVCALVRALAPTAPGRTLPASAEEPHLPPRLESQAGLPLPLSAGERTLLSSDGVTLERRRYGWSEVALLSSTGLKQLHPPEVCLRASGLQVVDRGEEPSPAGCLGRLRVRDGERERHFFYVFLDGRTATCKTWRRAVLAAGQQLAGRPARWSMLQVMDGDPGRARRRLLALLDAAAGGRP